MGGATGSTLPTARGSVCNRSVSPSVGGAVSSVNVCHLV